MVDFTKDVADMKVSSIYGNNQTINVYAYIRGLSSVHCSLYIHVVVGDSSVLAWTWRVAEDNPRTVCHVSPNLSHFSALGDSTCQYERFVTYGGGQYQ